MNRWLNFAEIKESIGLAAVLEHYQWKYRRRRGDRAEGRCPIHRGQREDAFHADLRNNGFHCFSCHAHGSVLDLVAAMEGCSLPQAALLLQHWFGIGQSQALSERSLCQTLKVERIREKVTPPVPLRFCLQPVDVGHAYLKQRDIDEDTAANFGVGYYSGPGLLHGRVVIPIHDERGQLLAYAGRSVAAASDTAGGKYKLPVGFRKSSVLFNLHRAAARSQDSVIVVEGFFDCLKVHQAGLPCVVALMGCGLSDQQQTLLSKRFRNITLMLDADAAGKQASGLLAQRLSHHHNVGIIDLATGQQPDQLSTQQIHDALLAAVRQPGNT
jgi:DNA primase